MKEYSYNACVWFMLGERVDGRVPKLETYLTPCR